MEAVPLEVVLVEAGFPLSQAVEQPIGAGEGVPAEPRRQVDVGPELEVAEVEMIGPEVGADAELPGAV